MSVSTFIDKNSWMAVSKHQSCLCKKRSWYVFNYHTYWNCKDRSVKWTVCCVMKNSTTRKSLQHFLLDSTKDVKEGFFSFPVNDWRVSTASLLLLCAPRQHHQCMFEWNPRFRTFSFLTVYFVMILWSGKTWRQKIIEISGTVILEVELSEYYRLHPCSGF